MPDPVSTTIGAVSTVGGLAGSYLQGKSAEKAAQTQADAARAGISEQARQYDIMRELMSPYVEAGASSLAQQQNLIGLNGNKAQQAAIDAIKGGSQYNTLLQQGQNAMLQNAAATGGLRGGNTQSALAQYSPNLLNSLIQQQYGNLAGITSLGQSSAAGVGNAGMQTGSNIANLLQQQGAAAAGGQLAQGNMYANMGNSLAQSLGMAYAMRGGLGGSTSGYNNYMTSNAMSNLMGSEF